MSVWHIKPAMRREVVVVGGGPVGGNVARRLAEQGHDVLLVEEHETVGLPMQCAGLFTPRIFDLVHFSYRDILLNEIRGAHIWSPSGKRLEVDGGRTMAVAINRAAFDQLCVERAEDAGAEVWRGTRALAMRRQDGTMRVELDRRGERVEATADLVVGADGVQSNVAQWAGIPVSKELLPCFGAEMRGVTGLDEPFVEMFFGARIAPGFFGWIVPQGHGFAMVEMGMAMSAERLPPGARPAATARERFKALGRHAPAARFLQRAEALYEVCACIPVGIRKATTADNVMIVGDAAAQTKPTTGGGVYTGLKCAEHLVEVADEALAAGDVTDRALRRYHDRWTADVGKELQIGYRLRRAFMHLKDKEIEALFTLMDDPEILRTINVLGDIDYPSKLARALLRKAPGLLRHTAPAIAKSIFA